MSIALILLLIYFVTCVIAGVLIGYLFFHKQFEAGMSWEEFRRF